MTGLITAVSDLTTPYIPALPALFAHLEQLVYPSSESGAGTSLSSNRIGIATDAFDLRAEIQERLQAWILEVDEGQNPNLGGDPSDLLARWLRLWLELPEQDDEPHRVRVLESWATRIRDMLPGERREFPFRGERCPLCGETRARQYDATGLMEVDAVIAVLRPADRPEGSEAFCRACRQVLLVDHSGDPVHLRYQVHSMIEDAERARKPLSYTIGEALEA